MNRYLVLTRIPYEGTHEEWLSDLDQVKAYVIHQSKHYDDIVVIEYVREIEISELMNQGE